MPAGFGTLQVHAAGPERRRLTPSGDTRCVATRHRLRASARWWTGRRSSLIEFGLRLTEAQQPVPALAVDREAVALYLDLHRVEPDTYGAITQQADDNLAMAISAI